MKGFGSLAIILLVGTLIFAIIKSENARFARDEKIKFCYRVTWRLENGDVRVYEHATDPFRHTDKSFRTAEGIEVVALTGVVEAEFVPPVEKP